MNLSIARVISLPTWKYKLLYWLRSTLLLSLYSDSFSLKVTTLKCWASHRAIAMILFKITLYYTYWTISSNLFRYMLLEEPWPSFFFIVLPKANSSRSRLLFIYKTSLNYGHPISDDSANCSKCQRRQRILQCVLEDIHEIWSTINQSWNCTISKNVQLRSRTVRCGRLYNVSKNFETWYIRWNCVKIQKETFSWSILFLTFQRWKFFPGCKVWRSKSLNEHQITFYGTGYRLPVRECFTLESQLRIYFHKRSSCCDRIRWAKNIATTPFGEHAIILWWVLQFKRLGNHTFANNGFAA